MGGRTIEMIETITRRDLPDEFSGTYEAKGMFNTITNRFFAEGSRTRWQVETEFRCSGLMKFMAALMPGAFKKQTAKFMRNFKEFAEREGNRAAAETR